MIRVILRLGMIVIIFSWVLFRCVSLFVVLRMFLLDGLVMLMVYKMVLFMLVFFFDGGYGCVVICRLDLIVEDLECRLVFWVFV